MQFPNDLYKKQESPFVFFYPREQEEFAQWTTKTLERASARLAEFFARPVPPFQVALIPNDNWQDSPRDEDEEPLAPQPYLTIMTQPPMLVLPVEVDPIWGNISQEKLSFLLYHELAVHMLESDLRPWPEDNPLWTDEWQFRFLALWLSRSLDGVTGVVNNDLFEQYQEIFEPEADGKTPVTIRGFDWYEEETNPEEFLAFKLLLERFASDILDTYGSSFFPTFLERYRSHASDLLSDEATSMLAESLGENGQDWLENLVYF